jgi:bifunctional pyridoxal-dependent enzyme with beta-cystathionase and maltose regulon repressor activities
MQVLLSTGGEFSPESASYERMNVACPRATVVKALHRLRDAIKTEVETHAGCITQGALVP